MADKKNNSDEPSIEEILSSIREIISDEDDDEIVSAKSEPVQAEQNIERIETEDDDILDLSAFAEEDSIESILEIEEDDFDDIDFIDSSRQDENIDNDTIEFYEPRDDISLEPDIVEEEDGKDFLIDKVAEGATLSAMARLTENISMSRKADNVTLEDIVRDLLRPMLKDWLDDNLPDIIERLVSQELERLAQKAARK